MAKNKLTPGQIVQVIANTEMKGFIGYIAHILDNKPQVWFFGKSECISMNPSQLQLIGNASMVPLNLPYEEKWLLSPLKTFRVYQPKEVIACLQENTELIALIAQMRKTCLELPVPEASQFELSKILTGLSFTVALPLETSKDQQLEYSRAFDEAFWNTHYDNRLIFNWIRQ